MPDKCHNRHKNFYGIESSELPSLPRFSLGQQVIEVCCAEGTGRLYQAGGVIYGMCLNPPHHYPGWWYWVRWDFDQGSPWLTYPFFGECHESRLQVLQGQAALSVGFEE